MHRQADIQVAKSTPRTGTAGFTLVEMAIAVAILGLAITTLLSLQTRYVRNYLQEESIGRAALYAQYMLSFVELSETAPEIGSANGDLIDGLQEAGYFGGGTVEEKERQALATWKYTQDVSSVDVAPFEDVLRRIELTVSWGDAANESYSLVYFMRSPAKQGDDSTPPS